jgi:hypothetical protein
MIFGENFFRFAAVSFNELSKKIAIRPKIVTLVAGAFRVSFKCQAPKGVYPPSKRFALSGFML